MAVPSCSLVWPLYGHKPAWWLAVWSAVIGVAAAYRRRLIKDRERWGSAAEDEGAVWLAAAGQAVLTHLFDGTLWSSAQLREEVSGMLGFRQGYAESAHRWPWIRHRGGRGLAAGDEW